MNSDLVMICARMKGSLIKSIVVGSGISEGALMSMVFPLVSVALNCTEGTVVMTVMLNSRSSRS